MIRKLKSGQYRLYSRKLNPKTGKRRNLGTFPTRAKAMEHEKAVQFFKRRDRPYSVRNGLRWHRSANVRHPIRKLSY